MIRRIVKLEFAPGKRADFLQLFEENKATIAQQPGCHWVEALADANNPAICFTYSLWDSENDLNTYRHSAFFGILWPQIKALFGGPPAAWSTELAGRSEV